LKLSVADRVVVIVTIRRRVALRLDRRCSVFVLLAIAERKRATVFRWDTASRSTKRQDLLEIWDRHWSPARVNFLSAPAKFKPALHQQEIEKSFPSRTFSVSNPHLCENY